MTGKKTCAACAVVLSDIMPRAAGLTVARLALLTGHKKGAICAALRKLRAAGKVSRFTGGRKGGGYYVYWTWNQGAPDG